MPWLIVLLLLFGVIWLLSTRRKGASSPDAPAPPAPDPLALAKRPPLAEQLVALGACGITPDPVVTSELLLDLYPSEAYEQAPYVLLLTSLGGPAPDDDGYLCEQVWHLDRECIEGDGAYRTIATRMREMAGDALPLDKIEDHVDVEAGEAWLSFELDGRPHRLEARVEHDWVDETVLIRMATLLTQRGAGVRFIKHDLDGQDCLIGLASPEQREQLNALGLRFEWL